MTKTYILRDNVYFVDKTIFGDEFEHYYDAKCYDGYAIAKRISDDENEPYELKITYPKLADVVNDKELVDEILTYFGLVDLYGCTAKDINYGDIMLYLGEDLEVVKKNK